MLFFPRVGTYGVVLVQSMSNTVTIYALDSCEP